jgi:hypothetical protein
MNIWWIRVVSQAGIYATFLLYLLWAARRGRGEWVPLIGAAIYAVLFEYGNMWRYANTPGGYHYHPHSWFLILGEVPLYIPLAWGFILATSRRLTDHLPLRPWARPCSDALLALLIDLSLDAVAIRHEFWYWHGVSLTEGFFGVPADNFLGWLLVSYTFSLLSRALWDGERAEQGNARLKIATQWFALPIIAYLLYLGIEAVVHLFYALFDAQTQRQQLGVFAGVMGIFLLLVAMGWRRYSPAESLPARADTLDRIMLHTPRHVFHLFGVIALCWLPSVERSPALWILAGTVWTLEILIACRAHSRASRA